MQQLAMLGWAGNGGRQCQDLDRPGAADCGWMMDGRTDGWIGVMTCWGGNDLQRESCGSFFFFFFNRISQDILSKGLLCRLYFHKPPTNRQGKDKQPNRKMGKSLKKSFLHRQPSPPLPGAGGVGALMYVHKGRALAHCQSTVHPSPGWKLPPCRSEWSGWINWTHTVEFTQKCGPILHMKRCSPSLTIRKMQMKTRRLAPHTHRDGSPKTQKISVGEYVEKWEAWGSAGRNAKWCSHCGKQHGSSSKN